MRIFKQTVLFGCAAVSSVYCFADDAEAKKIETSGNISVVSKYISRGLTNTPENDDVALQAALNLAYGNFYVGYWGSTLGYSYPELEGKKSHRRDKFEHDFIVGYNYSSENYDWNFWDATYYYPGGSHTTSNELGLNVSRALNDKTSVTAGVSTYLYDVAYANQGDTFYTFDLTHQINDKLGAHVGAAGGYFNDEGKYEGNELGNTTKQHAFRYATAGLSYEVAPKLTLSGDYIFGGYDRFGDKQRDLAVFGIGYDF
ncbi:hypothetical protein [Acinetobacter variabilis]|uniref:hypothetical protein n=1 Tax=Acinetobacter variabilis TaxID=70346 RepID=UPI003D76A3CA